MRRIATCTLLSFQKEGSSCSSNRAGAELSSSPPSDSIAAAAADTAAAAMEEGDGLAVGGIWAERRRGGLAAVGEGGDGERTRLGVLKWRAERSLETLADFKFGICPGRGGGHHNRSKLLRVGPVQLANSPHRSVPITRRWLFHRLIIFFFFAHTRLISFTLV